MTLKTLSMTVIIIALIAVVVAGNYQREPGRPFKCGFNQLPGHYFTTEREMNADTALITVRGTDGRVHAFARSQLMVCTEVTE